MKSTNSAPRLKEESCICSNKANVMTLTYCHIDWYDCSLESDKTESKVTQPSVLQPRARVNDGISISYTSPFVARTLVNMI